MNNGQERFVASHGKSGQRFLERKTGHAELDQYP
jgi:hypothetical protein